MIIKRIKRAIDLFVSNPSLFFERLSIHTGWLIWLLFRLPIKKCINGVTFEFDFSLSPWIKSMYFGWYDADLVEFLKDRLKPGDTFIDAGANIGYISAVAAGLVGKTGQVHSFEPAFLYFQRLEKLARMNPDYKIIVNQCALGEKQETVFLGLQKENIGGNYISLDFRPENSVEVSVRRLDSYIKENILNNIALIKIDVEGFEFFVLKGLSNYLENTAYRPIIVCEIFPFDYPARYGVVLTQVLDFMKKYGYRTFSISNPEQEIDITKDVNEYDVIFKA